MKTSAFITVFDTENVNVNMSRGLRKAVEGTQRLKAAALCLQNRKSEKYVIETDQKKTVCMYCNEIFVFPFQKHGLKVRAANLPKARLYGLKCPCGLMQTSSRMTFYDNVTNQCVIKTDEECVCGPRLLSVNVMQLFLSLLVPQKSSDTSW